MQGEDELIGLEDRQEHARDIEAARQAGARLHEACEVVGITARTLQRWKAHQGLESGDGRPEAVRTIPAYALTEAERTQILGVANEPRLADVPPARIIPALADEGVYIASESTFQRVLRAQGQTRHRGRAKVPRKSRPPTTHVATAPRQPWCWDMTFLPTEVAGRWHYLYLILDVVAILAARHEVYLQARERNPARWSGNTRDWSPIAAVTLNPERDSVVAAASGRDEIQPLAA